MLIPMPPFTFLEESDIPMAVRIKAAAAMAKRRSYSISKFLILATPRSFCRIIADRRVSREVDRRQFGSAEQERGGAGRDE